MDESFFTADESFFTVDESFFTVDESFFTVDESFFTADESFFTADESFFTADESTGVLEIYQCAPLRQRIIHVVLEEGMGCREDLNAVSDRASELR